MKKLKEVLILAAHLILGWNGKDHQCLMILFPKQFTRTLLFFHLNLHLFCRGGGTRSIRSGYWVFGTLRNKKETPLEGKIQSFVAKCKKKYLHSKWGMLLVKQVRVKPLSLLLNTNTHTHTRKHTHNIIGYFNLAMNLLFLSSLDRFNKITLKLTLLTNSEQPDKFSMGILLYF